MNILEECLISTFRGCEETIEESLHDKLGPSSSAARNCKLKECLGKLQHLRMLIDQQAIFSASEAVQDLSTNSLSLLLVPAYIAYIIEEVNVDREQRGRYLMAAKQNYRQFLEKLLDYDIICFKLPWLCSQSANDGSSFSSTSSIQEKFIDAAQKRQQKIKRLNQLKCLEETFAKVRIQHERDNDEAPEGNTDGSYPPMVCSRFF